MNVIDEVRKFSEEMSEKYGIPPFAHTELIVKKAKEITRKLNADEEIVEISCYLIDIGLGKALSENRREEHIKIGLDIAGKFLEKFNLTDESKKKILNSITSHHGEDKHICIESEIVKNADNFKFLDPTGIIITLFYHPANRNLNQTLKIINEKVEEKYKLITLDICKKEAEENYKIIKQFLSKVVK